MKLCIGVSGSMEGNISQEINTKAYLVGQEIAKANAILVTGATAGISFEAAKGAKSKEGMVIGVSGALNKKAHDYLYKDFIKQNKFNYKYFDYILYSGFEKKGRNVLFVRGCDGLVCIGGRIGTLNEFTIAYDEGKPIGILKTPGLAEIIPKIISNAQKGNTAVIYDKDPKNLVKKLIKNVNSRNIQ